jgi:tRNA G18 (ribose-2'-O)-methylase SpoU
MVHAAARVHTGPVHVIPVDEPSDPRVASFIGLRDRDLRVQDGSFIAESDALLERAVHFGYRPLGVLIDATRTEPLPALPDGTPIYAAGRAIIQAITGLGVHRGSLSLFERRTVPAAAEIVANTTRLVVLSGVMNPTNVGVIFRSAAAFGFDGILLDEDSTDPLYRRASRVSMGTVYGVRYGTIRRPPDGLALLKDAGFHILALTPDPDATPLDQLRFAAHDRVAIMLGTEGPGLSDAAMTVADVRVRIPIAPGVDSLNVAAAAAVTLYALTR